MNKKPDAVYSWKEIGPDPSFVKELDGEGLASLAKEIRRRIIEATSVYGGHLASNLGTVELTIALYRSFSFPYDKLLFDVGHQSYTHKILTGRSLEHLGEKGGPSPFVSTGESIYDLFEAGHAGTAMSALTAFAIERRAKKGDYEIVALVGDASIVNGLSFEALNFFPSLGEKGILVINDNDMSISRPVGGMGDFFRSISVSRAYTRLKKGYEKALSFSRAGRFLYDASYAVKTKVKAMLVPTTLFDNMGYTYIGPVDGHSFKALEKALEKAKRASKPAVVHVITQKGKGYLPAEKDETGFWHGVTPFFVDEGKPKFHHPGTISWSHHFGDLVERAMGEDDKRLLVCPAMIKGSHLEKAFERYPERCFDVGIAEEHALTMAGTLASRGYRPIVSIYSSFLQRAYDELLHDGARIAAPMLLLIDRAGLVGMNGATHQGIYDPAYLRSIPGVRLAMPSTPEIASFLMDEGLKQDEGPYAIRYPHSLLDPGKSDPRLPEKGEGLFLKEGGKALLIGLGPRGRELFARLDDLPVSTLDPVYLFPLGEKTLEKIVHCPEVFVYDPYGTGEGFASSLLLELGKRGYKGRVHVYAVSSAYIPSMSVEEQEKEAGVTLEDVENAVRKALAP